MKIYLILEYKTDGPNVWAEVKAFTSPRQRDKAFAKLPKGLDVETQDVEVEKREYIKDGAHAAPAVSVPGFDKTFVSPQVED